MAEVIEAPAAEESERDRINVYLPSDLRSRLKRVAAIRGTSESGTAVKAIERYVEWFEGLSRDEREAV